MSHRQQLDRLERELSAGRYPICGRPVGGLMRFVLAEEAADPAEPVEPCPRCHQPVVFTLELGSAVDDDR